MRVSRSTSMNAVAPHTVSSSSSKKCSSRSVGGAAPALGAVRVGSDELGERQPEHPLDLRAGRAQRDDLRETADERDDVAAADDGVEVIELGEQRHQRRIEADLLVGLAQRRVGRRLAGVHAPAREADLALVVAQVARPPGQQDLGALLPVGEGDEHGGRPGVGERRHDRLPRRGVGEDGLDVVDGDRQRVGGRGVQPARRPGRRAGDDLRAAGPPRRTPPRS